MTRMQREKGKRGERSVAAIYTAEGIPTTRLGNAGQLADLAGLEKYGVHPEVKMAGRLDMLAWLRQAEAEAPQGQSPVLHFRQCSRQRSSGWYAAMPLLDFIDLLKRATA